RCISGPEAVTVARHDRETADLFIANQIVDFRALDPGRAVVAAPEIGETGRPGLGESSGQVLRVGARVETAERATPDLPRRGGAPFCGFGIRESPNTSSAGGWPPLNARPPSRICCKSSGNQPLNAPQSPSLFSDSS